MNGLARYRSRTPHGARKLMSLFSQRGGDWRGSDGGFAFLLPGITARPVLCDELDGACKQHTPLQCGGTQPDRPSCCADTAGTATARELNKVSRVWDVGLGTAHVQRPQ